MPGSIEFGQVFVESHPKLPTPSHAGVSVLTSISDLNLLLGDSERPQPKPEACPHLEALFAEVGDNEIPPGDGAADTEEQELTATDTSLATLGDDVALYAKPAQNPFQTKLRTRLDGTALGVDAYLHNHWVETGSAVGNAEHSLKALDASVVRLVSALGLI